MDTRNTLIEGDPMHPCGSDLILQRASLRVGKPVPEGGWRVLSGNMYDSLIGRLAYRYEIEED